MSPASMSRSLREQISAAAQDEEIPVIIKYRSPQSPKPRTLQAPEVVTGLTLKRDYSLVPATALSAAPAIIDQLADDPEVEVIWRDEEVHHMLDESAPLLNAPQVWSTGRRGAGIKVAVMDTGIDSNHPDFEGRIEASVSFTGESPEDGHGHGTHVAGIIAGSGQAGAGRYVGVAPEATLLPAKVLRNDGSGRMSDVMAGVEWAAQQQVHVINLSLGADIPCDGTDALSTICDAVVGLGVVVCVASGNAGPRTGSVGSPGCARHVITVGATDKQDQIARFSSRGPTRDGRVKPDVVFPGVAIAAARASGTGMGQPVDDFYTRAQGTSMATPHAAAVCALILEAHPGLTPAQVKARLRAAAVGLGQDANAQGAGRGDALQAIEIEQPEPEPEPEPAPPSPPVEPPGCLQSLLQLVRGLRQG